MTLLRQTTEETRREFCSRQRSPLTGCYQPAPLPDRLRITVRRIWWLWRIPAWWHKVGVITMPLPARRAKAPPVRP